MTGPSVCGSEKGIPISLNNKKMIHEIPLLYDLENDPYEDVNIKSTNIDKINEFENILSNFLKNSKNNFDNDDELNSEEIENELRKLGYV